MAVLIGREEEDSRTEGKEVPSSKARLMFVPRPRSERNTASRAVAGVAVLIGREEEDSRTEGKEVPSSKARLMFVPRPRSERNTASRAVAGVAVLIGREEGIRTLESVTFTRFPIVRHKPN